MTAAVMQENPSVYGGRDVDETKEYYPRLFHFQLEHVMVPDTCTTSSNTDCNIMNNDPPCREKLNKPTDDKQHHLKKSI